MYPVSLSKNGQASNLATRRKRDREGFSVVALDYLQQPRNSHLLRAGGHRHRLPSRLCDQTASRYRPIDPCAENLQGARRGVSNLVAIREAFHAETARVY